MAIAQIQEAWKRGAVTGALLMGVAAAFPSVAGGCLLQNMKNASVDEDLVQWSDGFMRDRRVVMSVGGQDSEKMGATMRLPQWPPATPALVAIYIAELHEAAVSQVEDSCDISFVDDVTSLVEGVDIDNMAGKLERCVRAS